MRRELLAKDGPEIRGMFGRIAHRYDLLNRTLSLGMDVSWRRVLARRVAAARPRLVLDVCTGTADVALSMEGAEVMGADFCLPMLALARDKAAAEKRPLPLFGADALELPLPDGAVDVVTVAFGVRNFSDLELGLAELVRILRPGGSLFVLEFSRPRGVLAPVLGWWSRSVPPLVGRILSGDREAYSYLPASVSAFPEGPAMCRLLEAAGLEAIAERRLTGGVATLYEGVRGGGDRTVVSGGAG
jgi:demethylmenaquinone methyltransferase/2-methoxy-6-polyprenyl-1,4-benzoquinol methylase